MKFGLDKKQKTLVTNCGACYELDGRRRGRVAAKTVAAKTVAAKAVAAKTVAAETDAAKTRQRRREILGVNVHDSSIFHPLDAINAYDGWKRSNATKNPIPMRTLHGRNVQSASNQRPVLHLRELVSSEMCTGNDDGVC